MKTRAAQRALGVPDSASPLAGVRDVIVARVQSHETQRMAEARARAARTGGAGPVLSVLQKRLAEYARSTLENSEAPAITCADMHSLLKSAAKEDPKDRGLARAATHAYRLWSKDPTGALAVGDVARLRSHYVNQFPRSRVGSVIDTEVPRRGFNTLPVAKLSRIASAVQRAGGTQQAYEEVIEQHGLHENSGHAFRCRAFIRGLLGHAAEDQAETTPELAHRVAGRLATDSDPLLSKFAQLEGEPEAEAEAEPDEEAELTSPITGEPLHIELEPGEAEPEVVDDTAPLPQGLEVMGQLEDFAPVDEAVVEDPTDPEGGMLEVSVRPLDDAGPMSGGDDDFMEVEVETESLGVIDGDHLDMDMEHDASHGKCSSCGDVGHEAAACPGGGRTAFRVYASADGKRGRDPVDAFRAPSMAAALQHIASYGVRGRIVGDPARFNERCCLQLDNGNRLYVVASEELAGKDEVFDPDINEQQPDSMPSVSEDVLVGDKTMGKASASKVANAVLDGQIVKRAGWEMRVNGDADVELVYSGRKKKTASLSDLEDVAQEFLKSSAPTPKPTLRYAALRNTETGNYVVVTDVPGSATSEVKLNARRILKAVQKVSPTARGTLRKDAKLQLNLPAAGQRELGRVRRILEDRYRAREYRIEAQLETSEVPGAAANEGPLQPTPMSPEQLTQNPDAPAGTVNPPQGGGQQEQSPQGNGTYVGPPQPVTASKRDWAVTYTTRDGKEATAPVQARTATLARQLFERFNGEQCKVVRVAQFAVEEPGEPVGGDEDAPLPLPVPEEVAVVEVELGGSLGQEEREALRAALVHYRNQGIGPVAALDQVSSQYSELFDRYGEKTDTERHEVEAEAMKIAAEVWMQPAVLEREAQFDPSVNTQQPDAVPSAEDDPGEDSESGHPGPDPSVNTQPPVQGNPSKDTSLGTDSETKDPGSFGAATPMQQPDQQKQPGEKHPSTSGPASGLGADSETDPKKTKLFDDVSEHGTDALRSK